MSVCLERVEYSRVSSTLLQGAGCSRSGQSAISIIDTLRCGHSSVTLGQRLVVVCLSVPQCMLPSLDIDTTWHWTASIRQGMAWVALATGKGHENGNGSSQVHHHHHAEIVMALWKQATLLELFLPKSHALSLACIQKGLAGFVVVVVVCPPRATTDDTTRRDHS